MENFKEGMLICLTITWPICLVITFITAYIIAKFDR